MTLRKKVTWQRTGVLFAFLPHIVRCAEPFQQRVSPGEGRGGRREGGREGLQSCFRPIMWHWECCVCVICCVCIHVFWLNNGTPWAWAAAVLLRSQAESLLLRWGGGCNRRWRQQQPAAALHRRRRPFRRRHHRRSCSCMCERG